MNEKPSALAGPLKFAMAFVPGLFAGAALTFAVDLLPKSLSKSNAVFYIWAGTSLACFLGSMAAGFGLKRWGWAGFFLGASLAPGGFILMLYALGTATKG